MTSRPLSLFPIAALVLALGACSTSPDNSAAQAQAAQAGNDVVAPDADAVADAGGDAGSIAAQCNADAAQSFVGQQAGDDVVAQAQAAAGAKGAVRVIKPGQAVTMDFRGDRLNVEVDDQGVIVRISCG